MMFFITAATPSHHLSQIVIAVTWSSALYQNDAGVTACYWPRDHSACNPMCMTMIGFKAAQLLYIRSL